MANGALFRLSAVTRDRLRNFDDDPFFCGPLKVPIKTQDKVAIRNSSAL
jgi:hypothetical protein